MLFIAWAIHDVEEALAFPATCDDLANRTGIEHLRIDAHQSWTAVGIMGAIVATACWRGYRTGGRSRMYRAVLAGLEGHVYTHLAASAGLRRYTAGVATAVPIMLPAVVAARRELQLAGPPLETLDFVRGAFVLIPGAIISQMLARLLPGREKPRGPGTSAGGARSSERSAGRKGSTR
ncbi:HXXEE domain-containing protein [Corynebacterium pacaense]|uniref:HXXEE domain-containing protein n=1 Tax=Corynebacterium pacaense TaxID=1816684 RepID=UPI0015C47371|nr:HXXEE domain-containing protein [Corynebacterium pacaense]